METWRDIPGFDGRYQANEEGSVARPARCIRYVDKTRGVCARRLPAVVLTPSMTNTGYLRVNIDNTTHLIHRLIAAAFVPKSCPERAEVNHKNGCRTDNRACNLEWVTRRENHLHAYRELPRKAHPFRKAIVLAKEERVVSFVSIGEAARFCCVSPDSIRSALRKGHRCRGYGVSYV